MKCLSKTAWRSLRTQYQYCTVNIIVSDQELRWALLAEYVIFICHDFLGILQSSFFTFELGVYWIVCKQCLPKYILWIITKFKETNRKHKKNPKLNNILSDFVYAVTFVIQILPWKMTSYFIVLNECYLHKESSPQRMRQRFPEYLTSSRQTLSIPLILIFFSSYHLFHSYHTPKYPLWFQM